MSHYLIQTALIIMLPLSAFAQENWQQEAMNMVRTQIASRGVHDPMVLMTMEVTPRHRFVLPAWQRQAYADHPLPIGEGQTISQPYIVGLMTELLELTGNERVLEIGTGSGYQAAILSQLCDEVYSIEILESLAVSSAARLKALGYENVMVKWGDGYQGWPEQAPFDRIIVTAAPPSIPEALVEQLKPGGILVVPVGETYQELLQIRKTDIGKLIERSIIPVRFVPMIHSE